MSKLTTFKQIAIKPLAYIARRARTLKFALPLTAMLATSCKPSEPQQSNPVTSVTQEQTPKTKEELVAFIKKMPEVQAAFRNGSLKDVVFAKDLQSVERALLAITAHPNFPAKSKSEFLSDTREVFELVNTMRDGLGSYALILGDTFLLGMKIPNTLFVGQNLINELGLANVNLKALEDIISHELAHCKTFFNGFPGNNRTITNSESASIRAPFLHALIELEGTCINVNRILSAQDKYPEVYKRQQFTNLHNYTSLLGGITFQLTKLELEHATGAMRGCGFTDIMRDGSVITASGIRIQLTRQEK